ncbi:hypothetical protein BBP40_002049 [Aspergillus hancockii]|nr:hypothetical protein BBP40_002049 [Aspergillus hancockii]
MKLTHEVIAATIVGSALAAPGSTLAERTRHREMIHQTNPFQSVGGTSNGNTGYRKAGAQVQYSNNWAGVVREQPPPEGPYTAVTATFTVPTPSPISGKAGPHAGSIWVGIDGDTYSGAILQAGVDFYADHKHPNHAWFEWYPAYATNVPNFEVSPGNTIVTIVRAISPTEGVAIIENHSTGQNVSQTVRAPAPTATLAGQNAEWIMEDFQSGEAMVDLADFGEVKFSGAQAEAGGATLGLKGGDIIELKQINKVLTETEITGDTEMTVKFVG